VLIDPYAGFIEDGSRLIGCAQHIRPEGTPPRHAHARGQIAYCPDAVIQVTAGRWLHVLGPAEAVWLPGGLPHRISATTPRSALNLYLRPGVAPGLGDGPVVLALGALERELVRTTAQASSSDRGTPAFERLVDVLFDRLRPAPSTAALARAPADPLLAVMHEHWLLAEADDLDLAAWAERLALSTRTLQRRIRAATGLSFRLWRQQVRLLRAAEALLVGKPVKAAAMDAGYASTSAFVAAFREAFGVTPGALQRRALD
jgi:AraC-like DNA-binding protein